LGVGQNRPPGSAHHAPTGPPTGPLIPYQGPGVSRESEPAPKRRHQNCPACVAGAYHVCYACSACNWAENHAGEE
jgi:hypothetical protein